MPNIGRYIRRCFNFAALLGLQFGMYVCHDVSQPCPIYIVKYNLFEWNAKCPLGIDTSFENWSKYDQLVFIPKSGKDLNPPILVWNGVVYNIMRIYCNGWGNIFWMARSSIFARTCKAKKWKWPVDPTFITTGFPNLYRHDREWVPFTKLYDLKLHRKIICIPFFDNIWKFTKLLTFKY